MPALAGAGEAAAAPHDSVAGPTEQLNIFGKIVNPHGAGVEDAEITVFLNGKELKNPHTEHGYGGKGIYTSLDGSFQTVFTIPRGAADREAAIKLEVYKSSY
ncbi:MAG TPA: hypothetical protein ENG91_00760, partial [Desulfobacteraceae bacterium]|nr:hypothetical protein [Desulfobacteraceae bacterium]